MYWAGTRRTHEQALLRIYGAGLARRQVEEVGVPCRVVLGDEVRV